MKVHLLCLMACSIVLSGCSTWSTSHVTPSDNVSLSQNANAAQKNPETIVVTENDLPGRPYKVVGDIRVKVNKTTMLNKDPTREDVDQKLKHKAAQIGADAVILVRYGTVGVSLMSWGSLSGNGRAVVFTN